MLVVTRTPLRVSFFGGGTDLPDYYREHGGAVVTSTIDKYVHVMVRPRWDGRVVARYAETEIVDRLDDLKHGRTRECLRLVGLRGGVEITSMSDVPSEGCGLGASSAFTVGLLGALAVLTGRPVQPARLAELACHVEINMLGEPIGKQDQNATALGGFHELHFNRDESVTARPVETTPACRAAVTEHAALFFTGRTRQASTALRRWQANKEHNVARFHAIKEAVPVGCAALAAGDVAELGRLLDLSWRHKRRLAGDSGDAEIDQMYELARKAGAYGGKLLGAGDGGFFLFLCPPSHRNELRSALDSYAPMPFTFVGHGVTVVYAG
jgi:D-glycero-alpha-D-manno-heptose-7-phosphate kinase